MRILLIGMMAATFVLGMGFLSFIFLFGRIVTEKVEIKRGLAYH